MLTTGSPHSCTFVGPFVGRRFVTTFAPVAVTCFVTGSVDGQFIEGFDRELMPNLAMQVNYTYGRVTNLPTAVNNTSEGPWPDHCRLGGTDPLVGTTPDGVSYNLPLFIPDTAKVAATGGGRHLTNYDGYATMFGGIELAMT